MPRIGVRDLKTHASEVLRDVRDNHVRYVVTHRGDPVGIIVPYATRDESGTPSPDDSWGRLLDALDSLGRSWTSPLSSVEILDEMRR